MFLSVTSPFIAQIDADDPDKVRSLVSTLLRMSQGFSSFAI